MWVHHLLSLDKQIVFSCASSRSRDAWDSFSKQFFIVTDTEHSIGHEVKRSVWQTRGNCAVNKVSVEPDNVLTLILAAFTPPQHSLLD